MKNALKCGARAREGTKQFFISLRKVKIELLEGAVPFYYCDHWKNLTQRDKTTFLFTIFNLPKHFSASITASVKLSQTFILTWLLSLKTCKILCSSQAKCYSLLPLQRWENWGVRKWIASSENFLSIALTWTELLIPFWTYSWKKEFQVFLILSTKRM